MPQLMVPKWVAPPAKAALNEVWNDPNLGPEYRAVLRRLASKPAMRDPKVGV